MVDSELGLALVFNGCIYNYQRTTGSSWRLRLSILLER